MEMRVKDLRLIGKGSLKAAVDIELGPLTIRGLRVIENGKGPWVAWPREAWENKNGQKRYTEVVEASREVREAVAKLVLEAVAKAGP